MTGYGIDDECEDTGYESDEDNYYHMPLNYFVTLLKITTKCFI